MTAAGHIDRFVRELDQRHARQVVRQVLARGGLALGAVVLLLYLLYPPGLWWSLATSAGILMVTVGVALALERRMRLLEVDRRLELEDRLATWQGLRRRGELPAGPMGAWLAEDLAERIEALPEERRQSAVARRVGALRYLLPVLILLLVVALLSPFGPSGGGGPGGGSGGGGGGAGGSGGGGGGDGAEQSQPLPSEATPREGAPPEPSVTPPEPAAQEPPPTPEAPNPLADLEIQDEFAVPHFVGEGETRRQLARQARQQDPQPSPPQGAGRTAEPSENPPPEETDFERAYERALQSRHVPEHERPFVGRYFRILREGGR